MRLLKTPYGYFDTITRANYEVAYLQGSTGSEARDEWYVRVEHPECDNDGIRVGNALSPSFYTSAEADAELERIVALIADKIGGIMAPPAAPRSGWRPYWPPQDCETYVIVGHDYRPFYIRWDIHKSQWQKQDGTEYAYLCYQHHSDPLPGERA